MSEKLIGEVTHYFGHLGVAVFKLSAPVAIGSKIKIKGHTTDFEQELKEMQADHKPIEKAKKGDEVGAKVDGVVRVGDQIFLA